MQLNLNDIIGRPGTKKEFSFPLQAEELLASQVEDTRTKLEATGYIRNRAGALEVNGRLSVSIVCLCDRCSDCVFTAKEIEFTAHLTEDFDENEDSSSFPITDANVDLGEIFITTFFLEFDQKILCTEDCLGLCHTCGANLNKAACTCPKEIDSRFSALQQLLQ